MFEQLVRETASRFDLSTSSVSALLRGLLSLITNQTLGGIQGFLDRFRRAGLNDAVTSWVGGKDGSGVTVTQLESVFGPTVLDRFAASSGLPRAAMMSALTFLVPKLIGLLTPGGSLPTLSALQAQVASFMDRPAVPAAGPRPGGHPRWLPWAAAAALALVAFLFLRGSSGTIDPQLTVSNRDGRVTYSGVVRDDATRTAIVKSLETAYGRGNVSGTLRVDSNVKRAAWLPRLDNMFAAARTPGVDLSLKGDALSLGGWLSASERNTLANRLRGILGTQTAVGTLADASAEAVRTANSRALSALGAIGTSGVAATDSVVQAMNLGVINFATGSAEIGSESMEIIRRSADAMKRVEPASTVEIGGHTDNTGDAASNLRLSEARAEAVKAALVASGAPPSMLVTKGYGDTRPRAPNDTEYGRFQNRRIEYTVLR